MQNFKKGVQIIRGKNGKSGFNAGSKAINDAKEIIQKKGYPSICVVKRNRSSLIQLISLFFGVTKSFLFYKNIFVQYPTSEMPRWESQLFHLFLSLFKKNVTFIVHDLDTYRYSGMLLPSEINFLKKANRLIVHSKAMKDLLIKSGVPNDNITILGPFPYLREKNNTIDRSKCNEIVFAGNLGKSKFLKDLADYASKENITFNLYGSKTTSIDYNDNFNYMGRFSPEDVSNIKGKWGLVWDGDSLTTCTGNLGQYMRINSPHKVSLYIAAELPIIIWRGSALASFVIDNNLGIAIDSIYEISEALASISQSQYYQIFQCVKNYSENITNGNCLKVLLN